jgi:hypothetical protein
MNNAHPAQISLLTMGIVRIISHTYGVLVVYHGCFVNDNSRQFSNKIQIFWEIWAGKIFFFVQNDKVRKMKKLKKNLKIKKISSKHKQ